MNLAAVGGYMHVSFVIAETVRIEKRPAVKGNLGGSPWSAGRFIQNAIVVYQKASRTAKDWESRRQRDAVGSITK